MQSAFSGFSVSVLDLSSCSTQPVMWYHMTMISNQQLLVEECCRLAASCGFTIDYQQLQECQENIISHRKLAPAIDKKY